MSVGVRYAQHLERLLDDLAAVRGEVLAGSYTESELRRSFRRLVVQIDAMKGFSQEFQQSERLLLSLLKPLLDDRCGTILLHLGNLSSDDRGYLLGQADLVRKKLDRAVDENILRETFSNICSRLNRQFPADADIEELMRVTLRSLDRHLKDDAMIREGFYGFLAEMENNLKGLGELMPETGQQVEALEMLEDVLYRGVPDDPDQVKQLFGVAGNAMRHAIHQLNHVNETILSGVEEQQRMMDTLSRQLDKAESEARKDALTQLANRRRLSEFLDSLGDSPAVLLSLDLDHFKQVNDIYGHEAGDEVLAYVSRVYLDNTRDTDLVARYGGEEFCIILPDQEVEMACKIAETVRKAVAVRPVYCAGHAIPVTVSIGVARRRKGEAIREWLARGDQALYMAKHRGRDQVVDAGRMAGMEQGSC